MRPFAESAGVECRGYSEGLQRAMTDLGADTSFARAVTKLKEHYGIEVPVSAVQAITEEHGATMLAQEKGKSDWPQSPGVPVLIAEMDGSMLPVVETAEAEGGKVPRDRRKTRRVGWQSAPWRREWEGRRSSMGWGMGPSGLASKWRRSLEVKRSIWSICVISAITLRRRAR
jgi:hypothetical protein